LIEVKKPDFFDLLKTKFSPIEDTNSAPDLKIAPNLSPNNFGESSEEEQSENDAQVFERKGPRKQQQAVSLRVIKINKLLAKRSDLTKEERRLLQCRKNTATFRERRLRNAEQKHFFEIELDII